MRNKHLLLIVATIAFLSYYVPVAELSSYISYLPAWTLPFFWVVVFIPFWFNELAWRISRPGNASYLLFHEVHFEGRNWLKHKANVWMVISRFSMWYAKRWASWASVAIVGITMWYGLTGSYFTIDGVFEETHPFVPYYVAVTISWITVAKYFFLFKEKVEKGRVDYGQRTTFETQFSVEWYEEQDRMRKLHQEHLQKK